MGILNEARREFIAAPDSSKGQIVFKWPDQNIRKFSKAIVEPDAAAVFISQGRVMGILGPGQHTLDAAELPFLGMFIDWASNNNAFKAEIFFVGAREFPNCRFGGRLDEVQDPQTGLIVTLRAFGEYALRVVDPAKLIMNLVGTVDVTNNDAVTSWVTQQLLKCTRSGVTSQLMSGAWQILGLSMHRAEIEHGTLEEANGELADYGIAITRLGNLDINLDDDDNARLKKLAGDTAYSRLAGSFTAAAQAEMMQGAGQGMAQGGGAVSPAFLGVGLGMGQMMGVPQQAPAYPPPPAPGFAGGGQGYAPGAPPAPQQAPPPATAPAPAPAPAGTVQCGNCQSQVREGAKFCDSCGNPMAKHCTNCNATMSATSKFCAECGTPTSPPQA
ncbi:MAG TPA: SPFH domain-containing protein [Streptosporangiaceae bacterium]|nr:SPFH domain-containing protein [Streptosporangiaceae bacterium]